MLRNLSFGLLLLTILAISFSCEDNGDELYEDDFGDEFLENRASSTVGTYQAENRSFQKGCKQMSNNAGYTGRGFMDYGGNGSIVEWNNVNAPAAGQYTLVFRYANGSAGNRQCAITVNDTTKAGNVTFRTTARWTIWKTTSIKVTLRQGKNKIRVTANTGSGGPNLDKMDVVSEGVVATGLVVKDFVGHYERTPVSNNWHKVDITLENNALWWKNAAGVKWSLAYANGVLKTGPDCNYGLQVIQVEKQSGSNPIKSLKFNGELYYKRGSDVVDFCPNDPKKTEPGKCGCGVPEGTCGSKITHVGTTQVWDPDGQNINIARPSGSRTSDLLVLVLHRTDDDLPLYVNGWTRVAECYKSDNPQNCRIEKGCSEWHNDDFCKYFGTDRWKNNKGQMVRYNGHDLAQSVFYRVVGSGEPSSYRFNMNRDSSGHPGWIILTALRGAATRNPVRDWSYKGCDGVADSLFPSVYGNSGDMVLLSQSFDDKIAKSKFNAPNGTSTFGYVSNSDEAGFLFGGILGSNGETGRMRTNGDGGPGCKDVLISLTIKPQ